MLVCTSCGGVFDDGYDLCSFDGGALDQPFRGPRVLGERWMLEQKLAQGAMGVVFRATHLQVGNAAAVKLMLPQGDDLQVALARFHREAQVLGLVRHPNAVLVMDFGVDERAGVAVPYLVTELLRGESLEELLERRGSLPLEEVERILVPLCDAVEEAHQVGVVHRDLKPSNVFLERLRDGHEVVKVLDFGIAKFIELTEEGLRRRALPAAVEVPEGAFVDEILEVRSGGQGTVSLRRAERAGPRKSAEDAITEAGFMVGTIPFMAPEQITGGRISRQTDVYAAAALAFVALAGRLPFEGDDDDIIDAKLADERPSLRALGIDVPAELDALLRRCMALQPAERPGSVLVVSEALSATVRRRAQRTGADGVAVLGRCLAGLDAVVEALEGFKRGTDTEAAYEQARDGLLTLLDVSARLRLLAPVDPALSQPAHAAARARAEHALTEVTRLVAAVRQLDGGDPRMHDYLAALWARAHGPLTRALDEVRARAPGEGTAQPAAVSAVALAPGPQEVESVRAAVALLDAGDALDAADAVDSLLEERLETLLSVVAQPGLVDDAAREALVHGLFRHADAVLLADMSSSGRRMRVAPFLCRAPGLASAARFSQAVALLSDPAPDVGQVVAAPDDGGGPVLLRCLLLHPDALVRARAAAALSPQDFWTVAVHAAAPLWAVRTVFERAAAVAPPEYLKVFFLLVRENVAAAMHPDAIREAFHLLRAFFAVPAFHEDVVFEPLLDLDRTLRARASAAGLPVPGAEAYDDVVAGFAAVGAVETQAPASMTSVPLPIQRRLAREGYFLAYFACHANERVARETLPHLLRLEDVTRFIRVPTIHRAVLVELSRNKRFFRQDGARLALLQNPRTPAPVARMFLPFLPHDQVRLLAANRHIGAEVRQLAEQYLEKLPQRMK
ncbi:MAG: serine/threonine protein kinase [Deltaproteobacteria bacterium]|nr:serine/threonine protein kinase [Deltaproteobacteria bacterium]